MSAGAGDPKGGEDASPTEKLGAFPGEDRRRSGDRDDGANAVPAGRVGRAHGLDGSFYVTGARPRLLALGTNVRIDPLTARILRRAGTDEHPIVRLEGVEDRRAAEALRGQELTVELAEAPQLGEGEWWAQELMGCEVIDGERLVGTVVGLMELPSCEALEVRLVFAEADKRDGSSDQLLVPMVSDAIRHIDPKLRRVDVNMAFLGEG
ncbi:MAG TPA: ribosome maturation factor RimM [Solirubrobacteraceae bacterium]